MKVREDVRYGVRDDIYIATGGHVIECANYNYLNLKNT